MRTVSILFLIALFGHYSFAQIKCASTDYDCQITEYQKLLRVNPANRDAHFSLAYAYQQKRRDVEAMTMYDKYLAFPNSNRFEMSKVHGNRGELLARHEKLDLAVRDFTKALELYPGNAWVLQLRADVFVRQRKLEAALADMNAAVNLRPDRGDYYYGRGVVYQEMSKIEAALADHEKALRIDPKIAEAYYCRAQILLKHRNNPAGAVADYTTYLSFKSPDLRIVAYAYRDRGIAYAELRNFTAAAADLSKAIEIDPSNASFYRNRAFVYRELKMIAQAAADERKAEDLDKS